MSAIEDMTLGELSRQVEAVEKREEQALGQEFAAYVKAVAAEVYAILAPPAETLASHRFSRNGTKPSCVVCRWPEGHQIHQDVETEWQPTAARPRIYSPR